VEAGSAGDRGSDSLRKVDRRVKRLPRIVGARRTGSAAKRDRGHASPREPGPAAYSLPAAGRYDRVQGRIVDDIYLKHVIDFSRGGGRLVLSGDLTEATVAKLIEKLDLVGARPQLADITGVRFADAGGVVALARWVRRSGLVALRLLNAPKPLAMLVERYGLAATLAVAEAASRRSIAA
jgi:ABC-type transporter Mla MlaB component